VPARLRNLFLLIIGLFVVQVLMGTQVREEIDYFVENNHPRDTWIANLPGIFFIHRTFSLFWSALFIYFMMQVFRYYRQNTGIYKPALIAGIVAIVEIISGAVMSYFDVPKAVQPIHLLLSTIIYGLLVLSFINLVVRSKNYASNSLTAK
jgi:cytochrome c oxidase assembly protein subunit 15